MRGNRLVDAQPREVAGRLWQREPVAPRALAELHAAPGVPGRTQALLLPARCGQPVHAGRASAS